MNLTLTIIIKYQLSPLSSRSHIEFQFFSGNRSCVATGLEKAPTLVSKATLPWVIEARYLTMGLIYLLIPWDQSRRKGCHYILQQCSLIKRRRNFFRRCQVCVRVSSRLTLFFMNIHAKLHPLGLTRDRGATGSSLTRFTALWSLSKTHLS